MCSDLHFDQTAKGAFVRVDASENDKKREMYVMAQIKDVISYDKEYEIEGKKTNKVLRV